MIKTLFALGAVAVALSAAPAEAKRYTNHMTCAKWHHGRCITWKRMTVKQARRAGYAVGYRFAPNYAWTDYSALPQPLVTRYHLRRDWRYVNRNGRLYVVNPHNYRVTRVVMVP